MTTDAENMDPGSFERLFGFDGGAERFSDGKKGLSTNEIKTHLYDTLTDLGNRGMIDDKQSAEYKKAVEGCFKDGVLQNEEKFAELSRNLHKNIEAVGGDANDIERSLMHASAAGKSLKGHSLTEIHPNFENWKDGHHDGIMLPESFLENPKPYTERSPDHKPSKAAEPGSFLSDPVPDQVVENEPKRRTRPDQLNADSAVHEIPKEAALAAKSIAANFDLRDDGKSNNASVSAPNTGMAAVRELQV